MHEAFAFRESLTSGKANRRILISLSLMHGMVFPLPPLAEQERIMAEVERRLLIIAETEAQVAAELKRAERLRQSIAATTY